MQKMHKNGITRTETTEHEIETQITVGSKVTQMAKFLSWYNRLLYFVL